MDPFMKNLLWGFVVVSILALALIVVVILRGQDKLSPLPAGKSTIERVYESSLM